MKATQPGLGELTKGVPQNLNQIATFLFFLKTGVPQNLNQIATFLLKKNPGFFSLFTSNLFPPTLRKTVLSGSLCSGCTYQLDTNRNFCLKYQIAEIAEIEKSPAFLYDFGEKSPLALQGDSWRLWLKKKDGCCHDDRHWSDLSD